MHAPYFRSPNNRNPPGTSYELPPMLSVASPAPFQPGPPPAGLLSAPPTRPSSGLSMAQILHPPPTARPTAPYSRAYESHGASADVRGGILPDAPPINGSAAGPPAFLRNGPGLGHPHQQQQTQPLQQKRQYRQRRKDPSCDACRERKVKCDASESSSCTECTNRKVRCQFTKETNKRMSSIKLVQDLEKQLNTTKQQLQQLQQLRSGLMMDLDVDGAGQPQLKLDIGYKPPLRPKAPLSQDLSNARANLRNYGKGIWKVPAPYHQSDPKSLINADPPSLPRKDFADHLLSRYYAHIHSTLPVIHWPTFLTEYERVYKAGTLLGVSREWAAVLFGVYACGSLHTSEASREERGKEFVRISCGVIDVWQDDFTIDRARAALLASIFLYEVNSKSASWVWNGSAVRVAQEIGLHLESEEWSALEGEMRKRVWWGMYTWDRLLALEMGKPVLINDRDCDITLPCFADEQFITDAGVPKSQHATPLLAMIHVVQSIGELTRTLRSTTIGTATLEAFEQHFQTCLGIFPEQYHPKSDQYLEPRTLAPIIYFQNARLILHRHNISPFCAPDVRSVALGSCVSICHETARLLSRCMQPCPTTGNKDWRSLFAASGGTILCTHLWRCTLLLLFRQEYAAALICVQASAAMGDSRVINTSCGRYTAFFLKCLLDRLQRSEPVDLEHDEEMMAYVSGDMQGTSTGSWVWQGSERDSELERMSSLSSPAQSGVRDCSSAGDSEGWEGWEWVERTVQYLAERQQQQKQQQQQQHIRSIDQSSRSSESTAGSPDTAPVRSSSSHSRMTIASII